MTNLLPDEFRDLERFAKKWAREAEYERNRARLGSTFEEIEEFYQAAFPRIESILAYLNQFPLHEMPADAKRLLDLALAFLEASVAVELFGGPDMPWALTAERLEIAERWKQC